MGISDDDDLFVGGAQGRRVHQLQAVPSEAGGEGQEIQVADEVAPRALGHHFPAALMTDVVKEGLFRRVAFGHD